MRSGPLNGDPSVMICSACGVAQMFLQLAGTKKVLDSVHFQQVVCPPCVEEGKVKM